MASGSVDNRNANRLRGKKIEATPPVNDGSLTYNSASKEYEHKLKQDALVAGTSIKTFNGGETPLGNGDLDLRSDFKATSGKNLVQNKPRLFPAINFVDGNAAPPSENDGDIFVLIDEGNGSVHVDWDGLSYNSWAIYSLTLGSWSGQTPVQGIYCVNKTTDTDWYFDGSNWIQPSGGGTNFSKILFIDPNGDDGTGTKGNSSKPYLTPQAATTAATSGDLIVYNSGSYDVSSMSSANGLLKDGVTLFFMPNVFVTKNGSNPSPIFSDSGFTNPAKIYGYGVFSITSGTFANIIYSFNVSGAVFECEELTSTVGANLGNVTAVGEQTRIIVRKKAFNSGGNCFNFSIANAYLECPHVQSTAARAALSNGGTGGYKVVLNCGKLQGATTALEGGFSVINCPTITASIYDCLFNEGNATTVLNTQQLNGTLYISGSGCRVILNGWARKVEMVDGHLKGGYIGQLTQSGGSIESEWKGTAGVGTHTLAMSGGKSTFKLNEFPSVFCRINLTGGILTLIGDNEQNIYGYYLPTFINGSSAKLRLMGFFKSLTAPYIINLINGTLDLGDSRIEQTETSTNGYENSIIKYDGGSIVSNGARLIVGTQEQAPILATVGGLKLKGDLYTNTTEVVTDARKEKKKFLVNSVATTSITINSETFTESDTVTYNTVQLLAERLKDLIEASGTVNVLATWTAANNYFEVEADVAGTGFTIGGSTNLTQTNVRTNGQAMTQPYGTLTQNIEVE